MDDYRNNKIVSLIGMRGTGKTDFLKDLIKNSPLKKKLVVDTFNSRVWQDMKTWNDPDGANTPVRRIHPHQLPSWESGIYRMWNTDPEQSFEAVRQSCQDTLVIFEDATKYIGSKLTQPVRDFLFDSKQKNLDLVFVFHSLMDLPSDLIRHSDYITICKTGDQYNSTLRNKYPHAVEDAFNFVMASKNDFEKITIEKG